MIQILITGNVTMQPKMQASKTGKPYCAFNVAVSQGSRRTTGERADVMFVHVETWEQLADLCVHSLSIGSKVTVHGKRLYLDPYRSKDGKCKANLVIVADEIDYMDPKSGRQTADPATVPLEKAKAQNAKREAALRVQQKSEEVPEGFAAIGEDPPF